MKRTVAFISIVFPLMLSCSKPDRVKIFNTPISKLTILEETFNGIGPVSADYTRVFANLSDGEINDKKLIASGEYFTIDKVIWNGKNHVIICARASQADRFNNKVTLQAGKASRMIYTSINYQC